ncbi:MAG: hypothetical protein K2L82_11180 [Lachnospiraceae bacterium]|nr:hypothetical protein [Lachnospiraceae bacterium]
MNYAAKWNKIDSVILFFENKIKEIGNAITDSKDAEPDAELMILAATEHLRSENEKLKKREHPIYMIEENGKYSCPICHRVLKDEMKYCSNCGHRVIKHIDRNLEGERNND